MLTEAVRDIESYFQSFGHEVKCVILFTSENNVPARRLYEKSWVRKGWIRRVIADDGTLELLYSVYIFNETLESALTVIFIRVFAKRLYLCMLY